MTDFDDIKLRALDLSVLMIFLGLMRHRKAAQVAAEMSLTPSAISHALGRLRAAFDDPLFLRRPHGLDPTARAIALEPVLRRAVSAVSEALSPVAPFDPASATRSVRIAGTDYELATLLPAALGRIRAAAPGLQVRTLSRSRRIALAELEEGRLDLALGYYPDVPGSVVARPVVTDDYVVCARQDHPFLSGGGTEAAYLDAEHLLVAPEDGTRGIVDAVLSRRGISRRVAATVPQFMPAFPVLAASDLVATLPVRLVRRYAGAFGLEAAPVPFPLRSFTSTALCHARNAASPLHEWLLQRLMD